MENIDATNKENDSTMEEIEPDMKITKELRAATKDVHKLSDVLVNAKFAFALSDDRVWADGLLSFYEIYKFLENNLPEELLPKELHRTDAFEKDFAFFFGADWKSTYEPKPSVKKYLAHLEEVKAKSDILLFAYGFQMYMALMSGGQLLQRKRLIARKLWIDRSEVPVEQPIETNNDNGDGGDLEKRPMPVQVQICPEGSAATFFPEKISILKAKLRRILNKHYSKFDEQTRQDFIEESRNVFLYNSDVIRSIKGVNRANLRKFGIVAAFIVGVVLAVKLAKN